jgi:hypothetical protein
MADIFVLVLYNFADGIGGINATLTAEDFCLSVGGKFLVDTTTFDEVFHNFISPLLVNIFNVPTFPFFGV